jgi:hypothetical protein
VDKQRKSGLKELIYKRKLKNKDLQSTQENKLVHQESNSYEDVFEQILLPKSD